MIIPRFETLFCDTSEARDIHYQIRYKVFCEHTGFEDADSFPDKREKDEYDEAAAKFVMWDRMQRRWVAAMRLIHADESPIPSERVCRSPLQGLDAARSRSGELSRLAILRESQRMNRTIDSDSPFSFTLNPIETVPIAFTEERNEALLRLLWATIEWETDHNIDYCYFIITSPLSRMLKRFGIPLEQVGTEVKHRGVRRPYRCNVHKAREGMITALPKFTNLAMNSRAYVSFSKFQNNAATNVALHRSTIPERRYAASA